MPYTIRIYKPRETFRMHIRLERWPTVDFRRGRELTFALLLCASQHKDSLSSVLLVPLVLSILPDLYHATIFFLLSVLLASYANFSPLCFCSGRWRLSVIFFKNLWKERRFGVIECVRDWIATPLCFSFSFLFGRLSFGDFSIWSYVYQERFLEPVVDVVYDTVVEHLLFFRGLQFMIMFSGHKACPSVRN